MVSLLEEREGAHAVEGLEALHVRNGQGGDLDVHAADGAAGLRGHVLGKWGGMGRVGVTVGVAGGVAGGGGPAGGPAGGSGGACEGKALDAFCYTAALTLMTLSAPRKVSNVYLGLSPVSTSRRR